MSIRLVINGQEVADGIVTISTGTTPPIPPIPPTPGEWADEVARALKANTPYGTGGKVTFPVRRGSTTYILIDPKGFGIPWTKSGIYVRIEDSQTINGGSFQFRILELDKLGNLKYPWPVGPGSAGMYSRSLTGYTQEEYQAGDRFLLEVIETGTKDTTLTVKWG